MVTLLVIVHVFVCLFLIVVILLQAGRGQGLSWGTFGGTPQSILGTKTASFFTRLTTACAFIFLFTCIGLNIVETQKSRSLLSLSQTAMAPVDLEKIKQALEEVKRKEAAGENESAMPSEVPAESSELIQKTLEEETVGQDQATTESAAA